nr:MAG TPA: hypothetical protein [Caudoviricetes sp.]
MGFGQRLIVRQMLVQELEDRRREVDQFGE